MGLDEFGTKIEEKEEDGKDEVRGTRGGEAPTPVIEGGNGSGALTQWSRGNGGTYIACTETQKSLHPGFYNVTGITSQGRAVVSPISINVDKLLKLRDDVSEKILKETDDFWSREKIFKDFGMLHRRGYLFYGPQGSGKTALVQQLIADIINRGGVVFMCGEPGNTLVGLKDFRAVERKRQLVCVFEDIDAIIRKHGDETILSLLDGESQLNNVLNIATTNYPERLDPRIVCRPRRFDRVLKIGMPNDSIRKQYLTVKLGKEEDIDKWVEMSKGFSFAAMTEMVISVKCLGNTLEDTVKTLKEMSRRNPSSTEFDSPLGFNGKAAGRTQ